MAKDTSKHGFRELSPLHGRKTNPGVGGRLDAPVVPAVAASTCSQGIMQKEPDTSMWGI